MLRLPRLGKGQALSAAERAAPPGALLLVDADVRRRPDPTWRCSHHKWPCESPPSPVGRAAASGSPSARTGADPAARGDRRTGAALGPARARRARAGGGLPARARLRRRDTHDDRRGARGDRGAEVELDLTIARRGATSRGFAHRGRQLARPAARGRARCASTTAAGGCRSSAGLAAVHEPVVAAIGLADDLWSGRSAASARTWGHAGRPAS